METTTKHREIEAKDTGFYENRDPATKPSSDNIRIRELSDRQAQRLQRQARQRSAHSIRITLKEENHPTSTQALNLETLQQWRRPNLIWLEVEPGDSLIGLLREEGFQSVANIYDQT